MCFVPVCITYYFFVILSNLETDFLCVYVPPPHTPKRTPVEIKYKRKHKRAQLVHYWFRYLLVSGELGLYECNFSNCL